MLNRDELKRLWKEFVYLGCDGTPTKESKKLSAELEAKILEEGNKVGFITEEPGPKIDYFNAMTGNPPKLPAPPGDIQDVPKFQIHPYRRHLRDGRSVVLSPEFQKSVYGPLMDQIEKEHDKGGDVLATKYDEHEFAALRIALFIVYSGREISEKEKKSILEDEISDDDVFTIRGTNYAVDDFKSIFLCSGSCVCSIKGQLKKEEAEFYEAKSCPLNQLPLFIGNDIGDCAREIAMQRLKYGDK